MQVEFIDLMHAYDFQKFCEENRLSLKVIRKKHNSKTIANGQYFIYVEGVFSNMTGNIVSYGLYEDIEEAIGLKIGKDLRTIFYGEGDCIKDAVRSLIKKMSNSFFYFINHNSKTGFVRKNAVSFSLSDKTINEIEKSCERVKEN